MEHPASLVLRHLQVEAYDDAERSYIMEQCVPAADEAAQSFLGRKVYATEEEVLDALQSGTAGDKPMVANHAYRQAVLLLVGHLYRNREAVGTADMRELPMGAYFLLWPMRVGLGI